MKLKNRKKGWKHFDWTKFFCISAVVGITVVLVTIHIYYSCGSFANFFHYPEDEYKALEEEIPNVVVDNQYIEMEQLSDKSIYYIVSYTSDDIKKIFLKKDACEITVNFKINEDNTLSMVEIIRYRTKPTHEFCVYLDFAGITFISFVISIFVLIFILLIFSSIQSLIEDFIKKLREKRKKSVSKKDNS